MSRPCKHKQVNCEACREIADLRAQLKRVEVERDDFERKLEREESVHHGCDKKNAEEISDLRAQLEKCRRALCRAESKILCEFHRFSNSPSWRGTLSNIRRAIVAVEGGEDEGGRN